MTAALGPFEPGPGRLPPYLAGREAEQRALAGFVARLRERRPPPSDLILYGLRGNGKTVLLKWLEQEVIGRNENRAPGDAEIGTLWLTPTAIPTVSDVARQLAARGPMDRLHVEKVAVPGLVDLRLGAGNSPGDLVEALTRRLGEGPLVLLLDEAHRLRPEAGEALLNASQQIGSRAPFLLVLAGTPDLRWKLRGMSSSFWPRSHSLPIGRLSRAASRDAVRIPLRRDGIGISHGALDAVVDESRRYPFFLQLWGGFLWRAAHARRGAERTVRRADVRTPDRNSGGRRISITWTATRNWPNSGCSRPPGPSRSPLAPAHRRASGRSRRCPIAASRWPSSGVCGRTSRTASAPQRGPFSTSATSGAPQASRSGNQASPA